MAILAQMCLLVIKSDLYSTFVGSVGGLTSQLLATSDLPTPYYPHPTLFIFGAFFLIGRIFARGIGASIAKEEYRSKWCPVDVFMYIILAFIFVVYHIIVSPHHLGHLKSCCRWNVNYFDSFDLNH